MDKINEQTDIDRNNNWMGNFQRNDDNEKEINELTHRIIGCAMQVHRTLGNGF